MLSNLVKTGGKCFEKCNFYIKYFDKIKCYADRQYLVFFQSWNLKYTYIFFGLTCLRIFHAIQSIFFQYWTYVKTPWLELHKLPILVLRNINNIRQTNKKVTCVIFLFHPLIIKMACLYGMLHILIKKERNTDRKKERKSHNHDIGLVHKTA